MKIFRTTIKTFFAIITVFLLVLAFNIFYTNQIIQAQDNPYLNIEIIPSTEEWQITDKLNITFKIKTTTLANNKNILLKKICLNLPDKTTTERVDSLCKELGTNPGILAGPNKSYSDFFIIKPISPWIPSPNNIGFTNKKYPLSINVKAIIVAENEGDNDQPISEEKKIELSIILPVQYLIYGGFIGSILLAIFRFLWSLQHDQDQILLNFKTLQQYIINIFLGMITATIIIIISRGNLLEGLGNPISFEINNFYGGILVGLLSNQLGNWLYEKLIKLAN